MGNRAHCKGCDRYIGDGVGHGPGCPFSEDGEHYEIYVDGETAMPYGVPVFDCDCGRTLRATTGECDRCGAHYDIDEDGRVVQTAPPIDGHEMERTVVGETELFVGDVSVHVRDEHGYVGEITATGLTDAARLDDELLAVLGQLAANGADRVLENIRSSATNSLEATPDGGDS